jgi:peroxiredoxin
MKTTIKTMIGALCLFLMLGYNANAQMQIKEIDAVYKSKINGRLISDNEFQSYKGVYTYHKIIRGETGAKDTIVITPPSAKRLNEEQLKKEAFKAQVGKPMKPFEITDLFGNNINTKDLQGKTVVINFWFVACRPCIKEMPDLNKLVAKYKDRDDVVFLGFATDTEERLGNFLSHTKFDYEIIPNSGSISEQFLVLGYPTNAVVDKTGIVSYIHTGLGDNTVQQLHDAIKKAL